MSDRKAKLYEIHTREEWIRDFGLGAENYVRPVLDPAAVPESLRPLVPFAERYGISDDVTRGDWIAKQSDESLREFCNLMERHKLAYHEFLKSLPKDVKQRSKTARHFLYLSPAYAEAYGLLYVCRKAPRDET
jgi:hypothetical protein